METTNRTDQHAIVIGGSVVGLMTARMLAGQFGKVTLIERDQLADKPGPRKMTPQSNHYHVLLRGGLLVLGELYPNFMDRMVALGSTPVRVGMDVAYHTPWGKAYSQSGSIKKQRDLGQRVLAQSRNLLEFGIRSFTLETPNIELKSGCTVTALQHESGRITGITYTSPDGQKTLNADLIVDASGRGSRAPKWLADLGYAAPSETQIGCDLAYSTTKFEIPASYQEPERLHAFYSAIPGTPRAAMMHEIEGRVWHCSVQGRVGHYPPTDEAGFMEFARGLYTPKLYDMIKDAKRVDDIFHMRFPASVLRHYEKLERFPDGYLVIGDAICSVNPVHGQGMSAHALTVKALEDLILARTAAGRELDGLALEFFAKAAALIESPWTLAAMADFMFPDTKGERPDNLAQVYEYMQSLDALSVNDVEVHRLIADVLNLVRPVSALQEPKIKRRVVARMLRKKIMRGPRALIGWIGTAFRDSSQARSA